ncbi:MAG: hypothetical protein IT379_17000 [Deltaproteobacteria bacterium]|nr:hypothetical protein [Deltaproteobacteria bacterium]
MTPVACATVESRRRTGRCGNPVVASLGNLPATLETTVVDESSGASRLTIRATFDLALDDLPNRGETGDTWIVVRVSGLDATLFPVVPSAIPGSVRAADLVDGPPPAGSGYYPLAVTNPVLVDADGDGRFTAPFAPR